MHHLSANKELFGFFLCDLAGTLGFLLGAQALVLLQLAQLIGQCIRFAFHLLCQRTGLGTGSFQLVFALLDQFIPLFLSGLQLVRSLKTASRRLSSADRCCWAASMTRSGMPSFSLMRKALDLPGTPTLSL